MFMVDRGMMCGMCGKQKVAGGKKIMVEGKVVQVLMYSPHIYHITSIAGATYNW